MNNPKCRLINPAKSKLGLVSKKILEKVNLSVRNAISVNQWKNTSTVIDWFKNIERKEACSFIKFDIVEFYPSISENLLMKALEFAKSFVNIDESDIKVIEHARKSLLFKDNSVWLKQGDNPLFDVTMGAYDGAEACELVGLYLLYKLKSIKPVEKPGLYRDDGLAIIRDCTGSQAERIKKSMIRVFQDEGLKITIEANLHVTDFLDVMLDLRSGKYYPYRKPNNELLYVHAKSNHPPNIIKQLPGMINQRISGLSCNEEEFHKAIPPYEDALKKSGYNTKLQYSKETAPRRQRKRNVVWFNPPYSMNVKTNVGKVFFNLLNLHFPPHHRMRKLFNKNTVKVSYCSMENMMNIVQRHNATILNSSNKKESQPCNCRDKLACPLDGKCRSESIVYKATVESGNTTKHYYGLAEGEFKYRYNNHTKSFRNAQYSNETVLSTHIWSLKTSEKPYVIKWAIAARASPYKCGTRRCNLCITEKYIIATADPATLLNKRTELLSKCRHNNKFIMRNFPT